MKDYSERIKSLVFASYRGDVEELERSTTLRTGKNAHPKAEVRWRTRLEFILEAATCQNFLNMTTAKKYQGAADSQNGTLLFAALTQIRESGLPIDSVDGVASVSVNLSLIERFTVG